ncbi:class I SAM-dependent methyltransferase [Methylotuvimicrobium sp.]|uniref:class I SAM-dependent methyltransferase n=1 Tax=Methylotuvimicrobium sp. TaxID=2822413 RepID=UPI003D64ABEC
MISSPRYPNIIFRKKINVQKDIDSVIKSIRDNSPVGLHLGCGNNRIPGLINCDLFAEKADMKICATNLENFESESVDLIEHHHMIEHLSFKEALIGIKEWARVLKIGGYLIITCPNIHRVLLKWFLARRYWKYEYIIKMIYGPQEHEGMFHKSAYDKQRFVELLAPHNIDVEFSYTPYPNRPTPSLLIIARKKSSQN